MPTNAERYGIAGNLTAAILEYIICFVKDEGKLGAALVKKDPSQAELVGTSREATFDALY